MRRGASLARRLVALCALGLRAAAAAEPADLSLIAVYCEELRGMGLISVAESYALRGLHDPTSLPPERAQFAVELSRAYLLHAGQAASVDEAAQLRGLARQVIEEQLAADADGPRSLLVRFQQLALAAEAADLALWEAQCAPEDDRQASKARRAFTGLLASLDAWEQAVGDRLIPRDRGDREELPFGELPASDVNRLRREARVRRIAAQLALAEVAESPRERAAALVSADELLKDALRTPDPLWQDALRIARLRLLRLQGNSRPMDALSRALLAADSSDDVRHAAIAELVRGDVAAREFEQALERLAEHARMHPSVTDELRLLHVEALLGRRDAVSDESSRARFWSAAEAERDRAAGAWRLRCELLLDRARDNDAYGPDAARFVRLGRARFAEGDHLAAAAEFARASQAAESGGRFQAVPELTRRRASLLAAAGHYLDAAEVLRGLLARDAAGGDQPPAAAGAGPQDSLLYAWCLGRLAEESPGGAAEEAYRAALEAHLRDFSGDATASEAAWMLGAFEERRGNWITALGDYRRTPPGSKRSGESQARIAAVYERLLAATPAEGAAADGRPRSAWADEADAFLREALRDIPAAPEALSPVQCGLVLVAARIELTKIDPDYALADGLLDRILQSTPDGRGAERDDAEGDPRRTGLRQAAMAARVISLAGRGHVRDAQLMLEGLAQRDARSLPGVLQGLVDAAGRLAPEQRSAFARLQLEVLESLSAAEGLSAADRRALDRVRAEALFASDNATQAVPIFESLLADAPTDGGLLQSLARSVEARGRPEDFLRALEYWRRLEALLPPGDRDWLACRRAIAQGLLQAGQPAEARKLIAVTRIVYPELGGADLQAEFVEIDARAKSAASRATGQGQQQPAEDVSR